MKYRILIIEDTAKHIADVKEIVLKVKKTFLEKNIPIEIEPVYATNLSEAMSQLESVDAVMSDVFFPEREGGKERACSVEIMKKTLSLHKAIVLVTSTWHHGEKTQPVFEISRQYGLLELFDCNPKDLKNGEDEHKPWATALISLVGMVIAIKNGSITFAENEKQNSEGYVYKLKGAYRVVSTDMWTDMRTVSIDAFCDKVKEIGWKEEDVWKWTNSISKPNQQ